MWIYSHPSYFRLPRWLSDKESSCQRRRCRRRRFNPWLWKIPWRRKWQPTPVFLPGKSHGQRSLAGSVQGGQKELDTTEHTRILFCQEGSPPHLIDFQNKQPTCWSEALLGPNASGSRSSWNCTWETTEQADKSKPEPHWWAASVRNDYFQEKGSLENSEWERERNRETESFERKS